VSFRLHPWTFQDRKVKLHWYGNIVKRNNRWRIRVAFEDQKNLDIQEYPVGLIPYLRIGQWYHQGMALSTQKLGMPGHVAFADLSVGKMVGSLEVCRRFNYYLHGSPELICNKLWSISVGNLTYYIPLTELARALFATGKFVSNAMFQPNGLSMLLDEVVLQSDSILLAFSKRIPQSALQDDFIRHIAWILGDICIQASYESVFSCLYAQQVAPYGVPLEMVVPPLTDFEIVYRGRHVGDEIMVYEIEGINGLVEPFHTIECKHQSLKERTCIKGTKKGVIAKKKTDSYEILTQTQKEPRTDTNQPILKVDPTRLGFRQSVEIKRVKVHTQIIHQGGQVHYLSGKGGAIIEAGVDDSVVGGDLQPVEMQSFEIEDKNPRHGLERFLDVIDYMVKAYPGLVVDVSIVDLPVIRRFALLDDGTKRKCAIVKVQRQKRITYIIEVARPDEHSVTTLLIFPPDKLEFENHDAKIKGIIRSLVLNQGHWPRSLVYNSRRMRHTTTDTREWAERIYLHL